MTLQDMTREDLKALIREVIEEVLQEWADEPRDPDAGLRFKSAVAERLRQFQQEQPRGRPASEVAQDLGYDV